MSCPSRGTARAGEEWGWRGSRQQRNGEAAAEQGIHGLGGSSDEQRGWKGTSESGEGGGVARGGGGARHGSNLGQSRDGHGGHGGVTGAPGAEWDDWSGSRECGKAGSELKRAWGGLLIAVAEEADLSSPRSRGWCHGHVCSRMNSGEGDGETKGRALMGRGG